MARGDLQWCRKIACGRAEAHRTRRVDADGRPDCTGKHGMCGMALRGHAKKLAEAKFQKNLRPARRVRSKLPPLEVTFVPKISHVAPGTPETPTTLVDQTRGYWLWVSPEPPREPLTARACGNAPNKNVAPARACGNAPDQREQLISGARSQPLYMFEIISEYIDKDAASHHLDEGQRRGLKATAFQLSGFLSTNRAYQPAFQWIGNAAVQTTELMKQRRSWALAVLLTALSLSPHMPDIPPWTLATTLESDVVIRGSACKLQPRIIDLVYRCDDLHFLVSLGSGLECDVFSQDSCFHQSSALAAPSPLGNRK